MNRPINIVMAAVAAITFPILIASGCGGNGNSGGNGVTLGPDNGFVYSVTTMNCESTLEITDTTAPFSGSGYKVVYQEVDSSGDLTGVSYTDNAPTVLTGKIDTFIKKGTPVGDYEVTVELGSTSYVTGYIKYTGC